ncbi:TetR/AcrR family transcriptional regulator, partial [bacterium]|nr:TetR/AcrR family transcriptional regulator [bacterium]
MNDYSFVCLILSNRSSRIFILVFLNDRSYNYFMSRPKNPDIIRTRLLDVGLAAFAKRGYHGTGIKEIVDTANVPKGSFYNY